MQVSLQLVAQFERHHGIQTQAIQGFIQWNLIDCQLHDLAQSAVEIFLHASMQFGRRPVQNLANQAPLASLRV